MGCIPCRVSGAIQSYRVVREQNRLIRSQGEAQIALIDKQNDIQQQMSDWQKAQSESQERAQAHKSEAELFGMISQRLMATHEESLINWSNDYQFLPRQYAFLYACETFYMLCEGGLITSDDLKKYIETFEPRAEELLAELMTKRHDLTRWPRTFAKVTPN